jgi:tetratricopeptide (TPR) repeat protein
MLAGRLAEAIPEAEREARVAPQDLDAQERWIDALLNVGRPSPALQAFGNRVYEHPDDPDAHYLLARAQPDPDKSQLGYERALKLDPDHARSWMGLGAIYRSREQMADGADAYQRALRLDPTLSEAWVGLLMCQLAINDREGALTTAREASVRAPREADGYLMLAALEPARALEHLRLAVERVPEDPRTHAALSERLLALNEGAAAVTAANRALALDPLHPGATLTLVFARAMARGVLDAEGYAAHLSARALETSDPPAALAAWSDICRRWPKNALGFLGRARVQPADQALSDLEAAFRLDPDEIEVQAAHGLALVDAGRHAEALPILERAAQSRRTDANLALGRVRAAAGALGPAKTRALADRAATEFPSHVIIQLERAKIRSEGGDRQGAYDALSETVQRWPEPRLVLGLAAAARDVGRTDEAADLLERLARQTGQRAFADIATQLRAQGAPAQD